MAKRKARKRVKKIKKKKAKKRSKNVKKGAKKGAKKRSVKRSLKRTVKRASKKRKAMKKKQRRAVVRKKTALKRKKSKSVRAASVVKSDEPLLELLTGSAIRARMLRLLLREPQLLYSLHDAVERLHVPLPMVRQEARRLEALGLITIRSGKRLAVNPTFPFLSELRTLSIRPFPVSRQWLVRTLSSAGKLQLVIVSGIFLEASQARVDLFVVASRYSERRLDNAVKKIEAAVGVELRWAGMETKEFNYRWRMFDRFLRDIFTQPHERVLERIKITT